MKTSKKSSKSFSQLGKKVSLTKEETAMVGIAPSEEGTYSIKVNGVIVANVRGSKFTGFSGKKTADLFVSAYKGLGFESVEAVKK